MKRLLAVTTVTVLSLAGVVTWVSTAGAANSGNAAPVTVVNPTTSPVPVAGTVNVGNFPAAAATTLLLDTTLGGSNPTTTAPIPVAGYKTVRMYLGRVYGTGCDFGGNITVALRDTATGSVIDAYVIGDVNHTNKVYEAPGTSLTLSVSGPQGCIENIAFWGRTN